MKVKTLLIVRKREALSPIIGRQGGDKLFKAAIVLRPLSAKGEEHILLLRGWPVTPK